MKLLNSLLTAAALCAVVPGLSAQENNQRPPGGPQDGFNGQGGPPQGQGQGPGQGQGQGFRPPMHPLMKALDTNGDGIIDADEIKNASASLKKLDKNGDGKLTPEELRPEGGRRGGQGGFGQQGGQGGFGGPPGQDGNHQGGPGGQGGTGPGGDFVTRMMQFDKNGDGKLSKDEVPERMQRIFERGDTNGDGFLDKAELEALATKMRQDGFGGGQNGGQRGGPGQQGGAPGAGGNSNLPQRPPSE